MPCPVYRAGAQHQATARISAAARLRQWVKGKVRENRLRQLAKRQGLRLSKSRRCDARTLGSTCYGLATESGRLVSFAEGITLDEVEKYLVSGMANAKIIEYLSQTYGSVFVGDLIKHLPARRPNPDETSRNSRALGNPGMSPYRERKRTLVDGWATEADELSLLG